MVLSRLIVEWSIIQMVIWITYITGHLNSRLFVHYPDYHQNNGQLFKLFKCHLNTKQLSGIWIADNWKYVIVVSIGLFSIFFIHFHSPLELFWLTMTSQTESSRPTQYTPLYDNKQFESRISQWRPLLFRCLVFRSLLY